jgi:uncharacterized protein (UPF0333 family)
MKQVKGSANRGQALLEYSLLIWLLIIALVLGGTVRFIPGSARRRSLIELLVEAYQTRYRSYYFVLNSPFP